MYLQREEPWSQTGGTPLQTLLLCEPGEGGGGGEKHKSQFASNHLKPLKYGVTKLI